MNKQYYTLSFIGLLIIIVSSVSACSNGQRVVQGAKAPNLLLPDSSGNIIELASLKANGQLILVDFWASWCKPCREAHPELIQLYQKYKDTQFKHAKGFTVYSVSLDDDRNKWLNAVKKDKLPFPYLVNDLKGFDSSCMETYQFQVIPSSFLIDERGIIVSRNPTLKWLDYELKQKLVNTP